MIQSGKKEKVIGLIIENVFTDFAKETIQGIMNAIPEGSPLKLVIIAGKHDESRESEDHQHYYKTIYNSIYRLEEMCDFDGLIISVGTIDQKQDWMPDQRLLKQFSGIPKVFVASELEHEITVNYENETGIREAVDYLVKVNGCSRLCMLGGRDDNADARKRKECFIKCLAENNLPFFEHSYEKTDMSENSHAAARRLLDNNPEAQAIFCVNDGVAKGLYDVMRDRELVPGKDILVFGFDNTYMACNMIPSLTSIGTAEGTLGQKALSLLLDLMNGQPVQSVTVPTRLYGKESFEYDMYEYTTMEMLKGDEDFIYRMFDECFYRYRNEKISRDDVNLKRLFFEFISRMLQAMRRRYMSIEEFGEMERLIDIFFDNGAMQYTDVAKLLVSIEKLQVGMNAAQKSVAANVMNNRLFAHMKDQALRAISAQRIRENQKDQEERERLQEFLIETTEYAGTGEETVETVISNFDKLGLRNAAFYMYEEPVSYDHEKMTVFPGLVYLKCVMKAGELYVIPKERQECPMSSMFSRTELPRKCKGYITFPVFLRRKIYGLLICELTRDIFERGEDIAGQLGRALYMCNL